MSKSSKSKMVRTTTPKMVRTTTPKMARTTAEPIDRPGPTMFGEPGLPGFMPQPSDCPNKGINYISKDRMFVDLAICRYYCKQRCTEWHEYMVKCDEALLEFKREREDETQTETK